MKKIVITEDDSGVVSGEISNVTIVDTAVMMGSFARSVCEQKELTVADARKSDVVRLFATTMLQAMGVNVNTELEVCDE
ncbi:MAG: hypothetical protein ACRC76_11965 [Proteocatella sp.]